MKKIPYPSYSNGIHCHPVSFNDLSVPIIWEKREFGDDSPYDYPYRQCSYCGSIHPEDLLKFLREGATLEQTDWKYGWPHKFYVYGIANPKAGQEVQLGSRSGLNLESVPIMGPAPAETPTKFYTVHIEDVSTELMANLNECFRTQVSIEYLWDTRTGSPRLMWRRYAPQTPSSADAKNLEPTEHISIVAPEDSSSS